MCDCDPLEKLRQRDFARDIAYRVQRMMASYDARGGDHSEDFCEMALNGIDAANVIRNRPDIHYTKEPFRYCFYGLPILSVNLPRNSIALIKKPRNHA